MSVWNDFMEMWEEEKPLPFPAIAIPFDVQISHASQVRLACQVGVTPSFWRLPVVVDLPVYGLARSQNAHKEFKNHERHSVSSEHTTRQGCV